VALASIFKHCGNVSPPKSNSSNNNAKYNTKDNTNTAQVLVENLFKPFENLEQNSLKKSFLFQMSSFLTLKELCSFSQVNKEINKMLASEAGLRTLLEEKHKQRTNRLNLLELKKLLYFQELCKERLKLELVWIQYRNIWTVTTTATIRRIPRGKYVITGRMKAYAGASLTYYSTMKPDYIVENLITFSNSEWKNFHLADLEVTQLNSEISFKLWNLDELDLRFSLAYLELKWIGDIGESKNGRPKNENKGLNTSDTVPPSQ